MKKNMDFVDSREYRLFSSLDKDGKGCIHPVDLKNILSRQGLKEDDFRLEECFRMLQKYKEKDLVSYEEFGEIIQRNILLVERALQGNLVIPNFEDFCRDILDIFVETKKNEGGEVTSYIPELAKVNPDQFGVSVCTIDGQRYNQGDSRTNFSIQSICKTINYCLALEEHGEDYVHKHVGREPSGRRFNEISFNEEKLPHNPMINAGAVLIASLIRRNLSLEERSEYIKKFWSQLTGGKRVSHNHSVCLSESATGYRNRALAWLMLENKAFPQGINIEEVLELYFQCCSIEINAEMMSIVAATMANGGVCPASGKRLLKTKTVQNCLSLMFSCGMYDFSGEHAFSIGLPTKSGVGGALLIVIPNLMGICTWSPRLDRLGNSVRGIEFCKRLVKKFNVHHYDNLTVSSEKKNPRLNRIQAESRQVDQLIWAASKGDLGAIQRLQVRETDLNGSDYDNRTALHLSAAEGQYYVVAYLIKEGVHLNAQDRWGNTPLDDALRYKHTKIADLLKEKKALHQGMEIEREQKKFGSGIFTKHIVEVIWASSKGDLESLQHMVAKGIRLDGADYDLRTPLHLASCEGQVEVVQFLISHKVDISPKDRWGNTPLDDAVRHNQKEVLAILESF